MKIQVLGSGCPRCRTLAARVEEAAQEQGIPCEIEKVTDIDRILAFGMLSTPGLVVDGELKLSGRVPSREELGRLLAGVKE